MEDNCKTNAANHQMYHHNRQQENTLNKLKKEERPIIGTMTKEFGENAEKPVCAAQLPQSNEQGVNEQSQRYEEAEQSEKQKVSFPFLSSSATLSSTSYKNISSEPVAIAKEEDEDEEYIETSELSSSSVSNEGNNTPPLVYNFCSYPHCPIYILSKGRYEQERGTISNLIKELIPFTVVAEPSEAKLYSQLLDHLVYKYFGPCGMCCPSSDNYNSTIDNDAEPFSEGDKDASARNNEEYQRVDKILADAQRKRAHQATLEFCDENHKYRGTSEKTNFGVNLRENWQRRFDKLYHNGYNLMLGSFANENANARMVDNNYDDNDAHNDVNKKNIKVKGTRKKVSTSNNNSYDKNKSNDDNRKANSYVKKENIDQNSVMPVKQEFLPHDKIKNEGCTTTGNDKGATCFVSTIEEIRQLFTVSVLPENDKGVAYARNYILQILVPQSMIAAGIDKTGHIDELNMFNSQESKMLNENALKTMNLDESVYAELSAYYSYKPAAPHDFTDFYWVLDDDIYVLYRTDEREKRNARITFRDMMNEVCRRVSYLKTHSEEEELCSNNKQGREDHQSAQKISIGAAGSEQNESSIFTQSTQSSFSGISSHSLVNGKPVIFSCREACISNNEIKDRTGCVRGNTLHLDNYTYYNKTACYSLEYSRFAFSYDDASMAVNSYNTIACLFNYRILHSSAQEVYFPSNLFTGVRSVKDVLSAGWCLDCNDGNTSRNQTESFSVRKASRGENSITVSSNSINNNNVNNSINVNTSNYSNHHDENNDTMCGINKTTRTEKNVISNFMKNALISSINNSTLMMWYRFAVREDYDFTLQLIARGYYTVRFRNLSFEVPQMSKVKGGMTDYYKNCVEDMQNENRRFVQQWPAISQHWIKGKNVTERDDIRVRWDLLHPSRTRYPGAYLYLRFPLPSLQPQRRVTNDKQVKNVSQGENNNHEVYVVAPTAYTAKSMSNDFEKLDGISTAKECTTTRAEKNDERNVPITHSQVAESSLIHAKDKSRLEREVGAYKRPRAMTVVTDLHNVKNADYKTLRVGHNIYSTDNAVSDDSKKVTNLEKQENNANSRVDRIVDRPATIHNSNNNNNSSNGNWKGYAVEQWRDITDDEAFSLGLRVLSPESLRAGQSVAVILPFFSQNPSVAIAVLIEKSSLAREHCVRWNAVVQNVPGVAFLSVKKCYEVPIQGINAASRAVDNFFNKLQTYHVR